MGLLSKDAILSAQDLETRDVTVPEWGGVVRVKGLTAAERDAFESEIVQRNGRNVTQNLRNIRARLVAMSVINEDGARVFGFRDIEALGEKSAKALDRVFSAAQELSGLRDEDVDELAKNSPATPDDDLASG